MFFGQPVKWIVGVKGEGKPFCCQISTNAPHAPLNVRPEGEARHKDEVNQANVARFFGMIANTDDNVGRLLDKLSALGLRRDTLVILTNGNGGAVPREQERRRAEGEPAQGTLPEAVRQTEAGLTPGPRSRPARCSNNRAREDKRCAGS